MGAAATTTDAEPIDAEAVPAVGGGILLNVLVTAAFGIGASGCTLTPPKSLPKSLSPLSKYDKADDDEGAAADAAAVAADADGGGNVEDDGVAEVTAVCDSGCD